MMKRVLLLGGLIFGLSMVAQANVVQLTWNTVTCDELIETVQNNDVVQYGSEGRTYYNKNLMPFSERDDFCAEEEGFLHRSVGAAPVRTLDKIKFYNLCPIGRYAFVCQYRAGN